MIRVVSWPGRSDHHAVAFGLGLADDSEPGCHLSKLDSRDSGALNVAEYLDLRSLVDGEARGLSGVESESASTRLTLRSNNWSVPCRGVAGRWWMAQGQVPHYHEAPRNHAKCGVSSPM